MYAGSFYGLQQAVATMREMRDSEFVIQIKKSIARETRKFDGKGWSSKTIDRTMDEQPTWSEAESEPNTGITDQKPQTKPKLNKYGDIVIDE